MTYEDLRAIFDEQVLYVEYTRLTGDGDSCVYDGGVEANEKEDFVGHVQKGMSAYT